MNEHPGEPERNLLRKLLSCHGDLKAVAKVNVEDFPAQTVQHQVGGMPKQTRKWNNSTVFSVIIRINQG